MTGGRRGGEGGAEQTGRILPPRKYSKIRGRSAARPPAQQEPQPQPAAPVEEESGGTVNKDGSLRVGGSESIRSDSGENRKVKVELRQKIN